MRDLRIVASFLLAACVSTQAASVFRSTAEPQPRPTQFVFTSDAHYGLSRAFRGASSASAETVNRALVARINSLSDIRFPDDGGLRAGERIGGLDFVASGGDATNRAEGRGPSTIQSAATSWSQFIADYFDGLTVTDDEGRRSPLFVVPGNHEASNAVGFYKPMSPAVDVTPMVDIFNRMLAPTPLKSAATFEYARDRVLYSKDIGGVHFAFLQVWPDSAGRAWMERDLRTVPDQTPVVIIVHDQPDAQAKHFRNPNPPHGINAVDQFENLLVDTFEDGRSIDLSAIAEQRALETFLSRHPNVTAYFHGNSNWNEFYEWSGPARSLGLHVFRVDSPMKGKFSETDETQLSFHVATIQPSTARMTVRECFWNRGPGVKWGASATVDLSTSRAAVK